MQAISPSLYPLLRSIIDESYTDGIDRITSARENDDGTILVVGVDGSKQIACKISDGNIKIRLLNPDTFTIKSAAFSSANIYEQLGMRLVELALEAEFAAPKKSNGSIKKKTCKTGLSCGGTCISKTKICARALSIDQQKQFKELKKRLKGGDADAAKGIQDLKDEQQGKPKSKPATEPKKTANAAENQSSVLVDVGSISSRRPASDFDPKEIESLADSILESGGLYRPLLVKTGGNGYELMEGQDLAYHASIRANKKDNKKAELVNAFVVDADHVSGSSSQIAQLAKSEPEATKPTQKFVKPLSNDGAGDEKVKQFDVSAISSSRPASDFDPKEIESLADSMLQNGGLLRPMVLGKVGTKDFEEQFEVVDGHLAYHAAIRAKQKDPSRGEMVNGFVISPDNVEKVTKQIKLLEPKAKSEAKTKPASGDNKPDPDKAYEDAKKRNDDGQSGIGAGLDRLELLKSYRDKGSISDKNLYATLESTYPDAHLASSLAAGGYMSEIYNNASEKQKDTLAASWYDDNMGKYPSKVFGKTTGAVGNGVNKGHSPFLKDLDARVKKLLVRDGYED